MTGIVKPLRWPDTLTGTRLRSIGDAFGHYYCIAICGKDETGLRPILRWAEKGGPWSDDTYHSWDAAKDAAQADYEARILSTLTTLPTYAAGWEAVNECDEILGNLMGNIQSGGHYSVESTLTFLDSARSCLRDALTAPVGEGGNLRRAVWDACCRLERVTFTDVDENPLAVLEIIEKTDADLSSALGKWQPSPAPQEGE